MSYSSYSFPDGQVLCPYDKSHILGNLRAFSHLANCRKRHPELAKHIQICPYNQSHHIPSEQMEDHFKVCQEYSASQSWQVEETASRRATMSQFPPPTVQNEGLHSDKKNNSKQQVDDDLAEWM